MGPGERGRGRSERVLPLEQSEAGRAAARHPGERAAGLAAERIQHLADRRQQATGRYGKRPAGRGELLASVARNPLILACLLGFLLNAAGVDLQGVPRDTLAILGQASLTLGLLCVGASLELAHLGRNRLAALATCVLKLLLMPAATALACRLLGIEGVTAAVAVLFTAGPISASSYVLARQLGGDAPLMAGLITLTTIAAALTMPLMLGLLT